MNKDEIIKKIIIERVKTMSPNVKIALGSDGRFLTRDEILQEIKTNTSIGDKILTIQLNYLKALKEGIV
ncbi:MAG: hypothetical protein KAQ83_03865 [Nanoarchaeota archaeon]|nr:hypothetical protein [Nanoarchaeota archaeon]